MPVTPWEPPAFVPRETVLADSEEVLARPDIAFQEREDIFRIRCLGLDWDIGDQVYEPSDATRIARGADGKKIGFFLLAGGSGDFKSMEKLARLLTAKFGYKVVTMTYPGRLYLEHPSRDWPGDPVGFDGTIRTPLWLTGERITPDQYDIVRDTSMRARYGTRTLARAKPDTIFWHRMAAWPAAFEDGMIESCRRHFPEADYSIYVHGHSTGGPFVSYLTQRVANIAGEIEIEAGSIGYIAEAKHAWSGNLGKVRGFDRPKKAPDPRKDPFNELYIRSWRDRARYVGPEMLASEGGNALMRLPWIMEDILESFDRVKARPQFKAEYIVTHNVRASLEQAAREAAKRLGLGKDETDALVQRYVGYAYYQEGPKARPVPPMLFCNSFDSRDNSPEVFAEVIVPLLAKLKPAPRVRVVHFGAGVHMYTRREDGLPLGIAPAVAKLWNDAIMNGYCVV
jgi:hypothetical protein